VANAQSEVRVIVHYQHGEMACFGRQDGGLSRRSVSGFRRELDVLGEHLSQATGTAYEPLDRKRMLARVHIEDHERHATYRTQ